MKLARNRMSTYLIALGVIVAVLAIALTPGMADFSSASFSTIGDFPNAASMVDKPDLAKAVGESAEALTSLFKNVSLTK